MGWQILRDKFTTGHYLFLKIEAIMSFVGHSYVHIMSSRIRQAPVAFQHNLQYFHVLHISMTGQ